MNNDFEQHLRRQPPRTIPSEWRAEILVTTRRAPRTSHRWFSPSSIFHLPSPMIRWSALAAVWMVIFALNFAARDTAPALAAKSAPPSPQMRLALRQQQKLLAELIEPLAPRDADKPKAFSPRPHSDRRTQFLYA